jgi:hypothetical protein
MKKIDDIFKIKFKDCDLSFRFNEGMNLGINVPFRNQFANLDDFMNFVSMQMKHLNHNIPLLLNDDDEVIIKIKVIK